ncbi:MAG: hypothetical protein IIB16_04130 [Chloroflexi bacterium]|nr:hypothetical protein [Chloroflexota bacterium]
MVVLKAGKNNNNKKKRSGAGKEDGDDVVVRATKKVKIILHPKQKEAEKKTEGRSMQDRMGMTKVV